MVEEMKVEIVSREIIRPSSPTPPNLKTYNLSFFDQIEPNLYVSIILFYPFNKNNDLYHEEINKKSKLLKLSLSKTLTRFYPFAGRLNENVSIECYDEGAIFIEARVHGFMTLVLEEPDYSIRKKFRLSGNDPGDMETKNHLLQVQANFFECGGLAISVSMSHKLADESTMSTFIKAWSAIMLNPNNVDPMCFADFSLSSNLPMVTPSSLPTLEISIEIEPNIVLKRYVFDKSKINQLMKKAISEGVKKPTRVECVSALLWKCLMATSRSRFPFYEADFGWGKPTWVCLCVQPLENFFVFMDTRDGHGIETWCPLSEEKIALLEQDEEFLTFAQS
ncbi:hypothetical protein ACFE04_010601 [Oxalis oulophora]